MISYFEARSLIEASVESLGMEDVPLRRAVGRFLAVPLVAPFDVPHFDNSQVDGYAVFSGDTNPRRIVGESSAGGPPPPAVGRGDAVRIFTGAPLPIGADAVAMQEDARIEDGLVQLLGLVKAGENVRRQGEEIAAGTVFDDSVGYPVTPPLVGLAASFGSPMISVARTPRVAIVATGSELVSVGQCLPEGGLYASNSEALAAALSIFGIDAVTSLVRDELEGTSEAIRIALDESDVLITVGGVSVGDHDLVRPTLSRLGVEEVFWRVNIKPGKPFFFGRKGRKLVFGLPGNPVSALVTFALFVRPPLLQMLGDRREIWTERAELGEAIERRDLRYEFVRATLKNGIATPVSAQGSHMQTGLAFADALIHVPEGVASLSSGENVVVTPLTWGY